MRKKFQFNVLNKKGISYFEIILLILSVIAFSYIISDSVKASSEIINCCLKTKTGATCQDLPYTTCNDECGSGCISTSCEEVAECSLGCCYNNQEGICSRNVPKYTCEEEGGIWNEDASCNNVEECRTGCCVLGDKVAFVTARECERLTDFYGFDNYDFRQDLTELECVALEKSKARGACVYDVERNGEVVKGCKMTIKEDCVKLTGSSSNFYEDYLCTASELNTTCVPTNQTTCYEDKVYFVDSCGNVANIYDASKINDKSYWRKVVKVEDSCGYGKSNVESKECGNCDYLLGSRCGKATSVKPRYGDYICRDLNCYHVPIMINGRGNVLEWGDKKHGESWCIYESAIGNITQDMIVGWRYVGMWWNRTKVPIIHKTISGSDPVGSRHFIATCLNGNYTIQPCDEYRNSICVQENVNINGTNETFSVASCRINLWQKCLEYNFEDNQQEAMKECQENPDCYIKRVDVADYFKFDICLPKYKPGFDLTQEEGNAKSVCSIGSAECKVYYQKTWTGWKCKYNCGCLSKGATLKMNEFCRSLGDCGINVNVVGEITKGGFKVYGAPGITDEDISYLNYSRFKEPIPGKLATTGNLTKFLKILGLPPELAKPQNLFGKGFLGGIIGGIGLLVIGIMRQGGFTFLQALKLATFQSVNIGGATAHISYTTIGNGALNAFSGALAMASIFYILAKGFGLDERTAIAVALIGAGIGFYLVHAGIINPTPLAIIAIALLLASFLFGIGKIKVKRIVTFKCMPYERPEGGENCKLCNNKYLPCNRYKCLSLGSACKFINEGTDKAMCISSKNDGKPPTIRVLKFENYTYETFNNNGIETGYEVKNKDGECFEEWSDVKFGITTDKVSVCKIDLEDGKNYDDMQDYFESTLYDYNHTMIYKLPSLSFLGVGGFGPFRSGEFKFYVRCKDDWGNKNSFDYVIKTCVKPGKDTTPATITKFKPEEENAYLAYNKSSFNITIYTNEPAECRWSFEDKDYENMENNMSCSDITTPTANSSEEMREILQQYISSQTIWGFPCNSEINVGENKSVIYFRCKDQPWYAGTNESLRNVNQESLPTDGYEIKLSNSPLKITEILPKGEITAGFEPFTVMLRIKTQGGAKDGEAKCEISFDNSTWVSMIDKDPAPNINKFELNQMTRGSYRIYVKCKDIARNVDYNFTDFTLNLDTKTPKITRIYYDGGILHVFTNEDSECVYSTKNCYYIYENGTKMSGTTREHTTNARRGITYYIKCKDIYDNLPSGCSIKVKI